MRYDKVSTREEITARWFCAVEKATAEALRDDIIATVGDAPVVEVSSDVGAMLLLYDFLDTSLAMDMTCVQGLTAGEMAQCRLYLGKIRDTEIHLYNIGDEEYLSQYQFSIESVYVEAKEYGLKPEWNPDSVQEYERIRKFYGHPGEVGPAFKCQMDVIRKIIENGDK